MLLPTFLRKPKMLAILGIYVKPLDSLYKNLLYKMQHTGQVIYMEKVLNEALAVPGYSAQNHEATKQIYIDDAPKPPMQYLYSRNDPRADKYNYSRPIYLTGRTRYLDFVVYVPTTIVFNESALRLIIDYYRIAGKIYKIQTYEL
jgi:hypothetical protein